MFGFNQSLREKKKEGERLRKSTFKEGHLQRGPAKNEQRGGDGREPGKQESLWSRRTRERGRGR